MYMFVCGGVLLYWKVMANYHILNIYLDFYFESGGSFLLVGHSNKSRICGKIKQETVLCFISLCVPYFENSAGIILDLSSDRKSIQNIGKN